MSGIMRTKVKKFLEISQMNKSVFCKKVDISITTLYTWLKGEREISENAEDRIRTFMAEYVSRLVELAK